ncbi:MULTISPECIES: chloride channel protein [Clostridium]|uniref:chloride channel protein n=2 Tax=Clostridium TaxID=1485 RepID=UPI00232BFDA2|nr:MULTISPECIES: chloride channel protein [Clostridium]MDB1934278.1 chloride channel protein [Clostridium tertium]MDB1937223.1 chloride channel protein [Clostridium tertium]MDU1280131.1 chloride channel protein [Clostridium sp.]MDU3526446.1 chloride channel protein [Clostridium sp.]MDU6365192.1 chloride channel protein [Clostridium sp.]
MRIFKLTISTIIVSIVMGIISAMFLRSLEFVTTLREGFHYLIFLIPIIGVLTAYTYSKYGNGSNRGNNLIIESVHKDVKVPFRMAILTFIFTVLTHLSGGSAGREGTAVQIGGALTNKVANIFKMEHKEKRILIMSGISAAFGSVFGTPLAGTFFGMEVCFIGKISYEAMIYCFISSYAANFVTESLGINHTVHLIKSVPSITIYTLLIVIISSILFGVFGRMFAKGIHLVKGFYNKNIKNNIYRAIVSSIAVLLVIVIFRLYKFEGLSTWLIDSGFSGEVTILDPIKKLILTILTLGAGFQGGEVTPLFDIGASLGGAIGNLTNIEPSLLAAIGMICVFGSATNTPLTTIMLGINLFGGEAVPYYIIGAFISYYVIGHNGIYGAQIINTPKLKRFEEHEGISLENTKK